MDEPEARIFFDEHSGEPWFQDLCTSMAERGETTVLCVSRVKGVASLQSLAGPNDPNEVCLSWLRSRQQLGDRVYFFSLTAQVLHQAHPRAVKPKTCKMGLVCPACVLTGLRLVFLEMVSLTHIHMF